MKIYTTKKTKVFIEACCEMKIVRNNPVEKMMITRGLISYESEYKKTDRSIICKVEINEKLQ